MSDINEPRHDKTNKVTVRPAKTQISLGIRPVWSESSLSTWRNAESFATHWAHSEDSDQIERMPRLIRVFAGRTLILSVLSCRGSNLEDQFAQTCQWKQSRRILASAELLPSVWLMAPLAPVSDRCVSGARKYYIVSTRLCLAKEAASTSALKKSIYDFMMNENDQNYYYNCSKIFDGWSDQSWLWTEQDRLEGDSSDGDTLTLATEPNVSL